MPKVSAKKALRFTKINIKSSSKDICRYCFGCCTALYPIEENDLEKRLGGFSWHKIGGVYRNKPLYICPLKIPDGCLIYEEKPELCDSFKCNFIETHRKAYLNMFPPLNDEQE